MRIMFLNQAPKDPQSGDRESRETHALLMQYASPGTEIEIHYPDDYPGAITHKIQGKQQRTNGLHHVMEAPGLIRKVVWAAENGFDAVIQSNTFDPGVEGARLAARIPVIGLLRTSLHVGATLADRIAVIAPLESDLPSCWRSICAYRMDHVVARMTALGIYTDNLKSLHDEIFEGTCELVRKLKREDGVECILPLGGKLIPYVVDPKAVEDETGVPVLNTKAIGVRFAEMCVTLGLRHSLAAYPFTPMSYQDFNQPAFPKD